MHCELFLFTFIKQGAIMRLKSLAIALSGLFVVTNSYAVDLSKETADYKQFVVEQIDHLVADTTTFVDALKAGDTAKAKQLYPLVRMYYERSEPIAESFGDLDPRIDARLADLAEDGKTEKDWTGFHKIEKALWEQNSTKGTEQTADQLLADIKELRAKVPTVDVTPQLMVTGAVDLLNEVSTSKVTGEEDIFSKTDLYDFKANVEGAEKIFQIFQAKLEKKDAKLAKKIAKEFAAVNALLAKQNKAKDGYDYTPYDKLSKAEIKALAESINKLGEPLAQMGVLLEK